jgi:UDP-3-O-[3-hydroxymyristoyl] glucosamine N-acyltransferase
MTWPLSELARRLGAELVGPGDHRVSGVRSLAVAGPSHLAFVLDRRSAARAADSEAGALVVPPGVELPGRRLLVSREPRRSLAVALALFHPEPKPGPGIEEGAWVAADARLAEDVFVAAGARVETGAILGAGVAVHAHAVVGAGVVVGAESVVHPHAVLYPGTRLGRRVVVHAGSVIGRPGFAFFRDAEEHLERIPQVGSVVVEDDVEIGANVTIDRATLETTRIGRGTKIDNLVQIGHNAEIGEDCCLIAQVGISGSVTVGKGSTLAGQVGVADHAEVGEGTVVGAQSGVVGRIGGGEWIGYPAIPAAQARRVYGSLPRLPEVVREVRELRRRCEELSRELESRRER